MLKIERKDPNIELKCGKVMKMIKRQEISLRI